MQIIFQTHFPKNIMGSFVYNRTIKQKGTDCIDDIFIELARALSGYFSLEHSQIESYPHVNISDFSPENFISKKSLKIIFKRMNNDSDELKIFEITFHFNTANNHLINKRINEEQIFHLDDEAFKMLDTLITTSSSEYA